jgi:hypothetical protein
MKEYLEKNKDTLIKAVAGLPVYPPPSHVWAGIERGLEQQEHLQRALANLPQHAAPAAIWDNIEQALDKPQQRPRSSLYRALRAYRPWIAAASLCGLAIGGWWLVDSESAPTTTIAFAEEVQMRANFAIDWNDEEEEIATVIARVEQSPLADPQVVTRLKREYHELNDARSEVEEMLKRYGQDEHLLKEVARIERERSQVIKELATWI